MKDWRAPLEQDEIARPIVFFVLLFGGAALVEIFVLVHLLGIRDLLVMSLFFFACATVGLLLFARWQTGSWNPGGAVRARWREREAGSFRTYGVVIIATFAYAQKRGWTHWLDN